VFSYVARRARIEPKSGRQLIRAERYPITYAGIRSASDRDWGKAGLKIRRHDMRHTVGMRMLREMGDIKAVSEFLGHCPGNLKWLTSPFESVDNRPEARDTTAARRVAARSALMMPEAT
jgi:integrase